MDHFRNFLYHLYEKYKRLTKIQLLFHFPIKISIFFSKLMLIGYPLISPFILYKYLLDMYNVGRSKINQFLFIKNNDMKKICVFKILHGKSR